MKYIITIETEETIKTETIPPAKLRVKIHDRRDNESYHDVIEYDWVENPNREPTVTYEKRTTGIYTQIVDDLDIVSVINAVNKNKISSKQSC